MNTWPGQRLREAVRAGDLEASLAAVETMRRLLYPKPLLRSILRHCHPGLDDVFLDPHLVPAPLLLAPVLPEALARLPLDRRRLAICHGDDLGAFARSGLNRVLRGERPLYPELPAIPIEVYRDELCLTPERRAWLQELSALECLALEAEPGAVPINSALRRWHPSDLDGHLGSLWVALHVTSANGESPEQAGADACLLALRLGFDAARVVNGPADCDALVEEAAQAVLGRGAWYGVWTHPSPPDRDWGEWIRGLTSVESAPLLQLVDSGEGVYSQVPVRPCGSLSLLAIDARWLARRDPDRVASFLCHWLAEAERARSVAGSSPVGVRKQARSPRHRSPRRWRGVLLLAVTDPLVEAVGLEALQRRACQRAIDGAFERGELLWLDHPLAGQCRSWAAAGDVRTVLVFLGPDDHALPGAWGELQRHLSWQEADLICSDEELLWCREPRKLGVRQLDAPPTPFRLLTRGDIPGLVAIPAAVIADLQDTGPYTSLHALLRDLALQLYGRQGQIVHLPAVLLHRDPVSNPAVLAIRNPGDGHGFSRRQLQELGDLTRRHSLVWLRPEGAVTPGPRQGTFMVRRLPQPGDRVSVLIPFRNHAALTRSCVQSLLEHAGEVDLEIVLIDNGSTEADAIGLAEDLRTQSSVPVIAVRDEHPFNFAAINNRARKHCSGNFLLFLNNDIAFRSPRVIEQLLDPFGFHRVAAVSTRLLYGDGRIQHHGLMAVAGRMQDMGSPGKGMLPGGLADMFIALAGQEQWSAATAACLMVRAEDFDRVAGFDEDFAVAYNDVDLCWRLNRNGHAVVVTSEPQILHLESRSRGRDRMGDKRKRLYQESARLRDRYPHYFRQGDPLHHPWLHPGSRTFEPTTPPAHPRRESRDQLVWAWMRPDFRVGPPRPFMIYVHWDADAGIRSDVIDQIRCYRKHADLAFVSACPALAGREHALKQLRQLCDVILIRENEGYDFGSWKAGIRYCWHAIQQAPRLILANDSCYGPITSLDELFRRLERSDADAVGLTEATTIRAHLQSYFIAYRRRLVRAPIFRAFWDGIGVWDDKLALVTANEVGWSAALEELGFTHEALYMSHHGNLSHTHWRELIEDHDFPFIKKELLQLNPKGQDISSWREVVGARNPVLLRQIEEHLAQSIQA